jgi:hypothetical protein
MPKTQQPEKDPLTNNLGKTVSERPLGPVVFNTSGGTPVKAGSHRHQCEICSGSFTLVRPAAGEDLGADDFCRANGFDVPSDAHDVNDEEFDDGDYG